MSDLRKVAEMVLEKLTALGYTNPQQDDIDQIKYTLRQALAQPEQEPVDCVYPKCETAGGCDGPCSKPLTTPVDAVNMSQERVDETAKREHEPASWFIQYEYRHEFLWRKPNELEQKTALEIKPLYTAPPKREWVGLTDVDKVNLRGMILGGRFLECIDATEAKLKEKNT